MRRSISWFVLALTLVFLEGMATAAVPVATTKADDITGELDKIEHSLDSHHVAIEKLDDFLSTLTRAKAWGQQCVDEQVQLLSRTEAQLEAVGAPARGESENVIKQRARLSKEKSRTEKELTTCRVIVQRSDQLGGMVSTVRRDAHARELFASGPGLLSLLKTVALERDATSALLGHSGELVPLSGAEKARLGWYTAIAILIGGLFRKGIQRAIRRMDGLADDGTSCRMALLVTLRRYVAVLMGATTAAVFLYLQTGHVRPLPFINIAAYGFPLVLILLMAANALVKPLLLVLSESYSETDLAAQLSRRLKALVMLVYIGYLLFATILAQSLPQTVFLLASIIYGAFLIVNLIWILWLIGTTSNSRIRLLLRVIATLLLTAALVAAVLGYHNLSEYILRVVVGTILVLGLYFLAGSIVRAQLDALDEDKGVWQRKLRSLLGLKPEQLVPGILWIRILLALTLWAGLFFGLTIAWRVPQATIEAFVGNVTNGFVIGSFSLKPLDIVQGIFFLVVLLTLNSWFKKWLEQEWLNKTRLDHGARESVATISGYIGVSISILVALGVAGVDFSRLALIAGALSVGIGFGLQNIVSNFISGLILLFERPVKTGDWIVVGDIEGYVKRISIRTTQIMTFDRADVIVPNSELISGNVTNMMLHDLRGRLRIPVGVAYGTDTQTVKQLLLDIAGGHPEVLGDGFGVPAPYVLFVEFGDSSLDFELRCFIPNIDRRKRVISDINFAIDEAFREHGIEIPFPQRDIHIRQDSDESSLSGPERPDRKPPGSSPGTRPTPPDQDSAQENDN